MLEVINAWTSIISPRATVFVKAALFDFFKADEVLADAQIMRFTLRPENQSTEENPTEFMLFSDRFTQNFPSYVLDDRTRIRPGPETPVINFDNLKELLLSKDVARNAELDWVSSKNIRFLDGTDISGQ